MKQPKRNGCYYLLSILVTILGKVKKPSMPLSIEKISNDSDPIRICIQATVFFLKCKVIGFI